MIVAGTFALLRPWWLLALPLIAAAYVLSRPKRGALATWEKASDPHLLAAMVARSGRHSGGRSGRGASALLVTLALAAVALSGPAIRRNSGGHLRNLDAVVLVNDVSQSMADTGLLRQAVGVDAELLKHIGARQAALVVYAGDAYTATAFTDYPEAVSTDLFALDDTTVPDPGHRVDRALALAGRLLDEAHILSGDVVLTTAGAGLDGAALRAAKALAAAGRQVFVIAVAPPGKPETLAHAAALAAIGDGFAVNWTNPQRLYDTLGSQTISRTASSIIRSLAWRDLGQWVLALAVLPLLLGFRRAAAA